MANHGSQISLANSGASTALRCGLYMAAKKRPKFDAFVADARIRGLEMIDLDLDKDYVAPGHLDAIVSD